VICLFIVPRLNDSTQHFIDMKNKDLTDIKNLNDVQNTRINSTREFSCAIG